MSAAKFIKGPVLFNEAKLVPDSEGKFILAGRFALAEDVNENVRVYTKRLWRNLLAKPSVKQMIKDKRMLGQLGHPDTVEPDLQNVSHAVTYLELRDDGEVYGEAEIFDTPAGKILKILYNAGVRLGISSRGYIPDDVEYTEGIGQEVPDEYELVGFDFVIDPSTHGAFPTLKESTKQQLNRIVLESKKQLGKSLCESVNKMIKSNPTVELSFPLTGTSPVRRKQIRGLMESKYPEADFSIHDDKLHISNLSVSQQVAASSDFNKLVNENNFIRRVNASSPNEKDKEVKSMAKVPTPVSKTAILEGNYALAQEVIAELLNDKAVSTGVIEDLVKRYKISESKVAKLTKQLEDADTSATDKVAEDVIEELKNRYLIAEDIIKDLVSRYNAKSKALKSLQKKYNMAEAVVSEMKQATVQNKKADTSCDEETSEEVIAELVRRLKSSEEVIAELRDRYLVAEGVIKDLTGRYTLSESVISEMASNIHSVEDENTQLKERCTLSEEVIAQLKSKVASTEEEVKAAKKASSLSKTATAPTKKATKTVTESKKVAPTKKASNRDYSEYPYTSKESTKKPVTESYAKKTTTSAATRRSSFEDKLASIVASVQ